MSEEKLVFVIGIWRSGTSLLHGMLNQHPQIALTFEAQPFVIWPQHEDAILSDDWRQRLDFFSGTIHRHGLHTASLPARASARQAALAIYRAYAGRRGATVIGEKAPFYHTKLLNIARIFPQAHFIIIWRDPMECCRSTKWAENFQEGFDQKGMLLRTLLGAAVMAEGVDQLRRDGRRVHEVVYANLVKNSEAELRDICKFLEISFDARMLNLETADRTASPGLQPQIIHSALKGKQLLPPAFVVKCERYAALWSGRYAHLKFAEVLSSFPNRRKPGITEQWMDRGAYFFWRRVDVFKWFVFRHIPLSWWELFRKMKSKLQPNRRVSNADENQLISCETTVNAEKF